MPVTTEPPWLNRSVGLTAPNGTTTTTIPLGFTPATGSLLVVLAAGSVTNAAAGWTKRAGPVSSAETSLFDKVAAGDTSIAITHNGADYAIAYVVWEFPSGSVFTGVVSSATTVDDLMPALTLPGSAQLVIAALGRGVAATTGTASSVWTAPMVENQDVVRLVPPTTGIYLTVAHQINVTATSITPALTYTSTLSASANDRQKIVAAYDVAAPPPAVTAADVERVGNASAARTMRSLGGMPRA